MKYIETKLTEKRFLNRIQTLCTEKTLFDRYNDRECFVTKRNKNKFWIGKYYPCKYYPYKGRYGGYGSNGIFLKYNVNQKGHVDIEYRFGILLSLLVPNIVCFTAGMALWIPLVYEAVVCKNVQWGGPCVSSLFWIIGLVGLSFRSSKEKVILEKHLLRICDIMT